MRHRIAKVDQETISEQLGDMPIVALNHVGTHPLIGTHHLPVLFGVELSRQGSGIDEVTEHHGELPTFGFGGVMVGLWRCGSRLCFLADRLWRGLDSLSHWLRVRAAIAGPYQDALLFIHCQVL